ncbi:hypothetical protein [Nocardioides daejeonensis]|uniref:spermine/spermidine synthase domain-containing protein n=1 Tax=Nocardioides daejeonensis TaxID=1046556 RepID=UPI000D740DDD|nr:hypothetical protein [Nocardioides daejeonensis]
MSSSEVARVESPRGTVVLHRRERHGREVLELRVNGIFVMDTLETTSERALASVALAAVEKPGHVLIGGLGLGYTLEEVLSDPRVTAVTCVELEECLVAWMRDGTIAHGPGLLADPRVRMVTSDVADVLVAADATYDLVLLDVDNGPDYLVHDHNHRLYRPDFLTAAARATRQVLAIWSATRSDALEAAMRSVVGNCTAASYEVKLGTRPETYWLYVSSPGAGE